MRHVRIRNRFGYCSCKRVLITKHLYTQGIVIITARKRSCGKVMFLQVSVILFTGGGGACLVPRGVPSSGGCLVLGGAWSWGDAYHPLLGRISQHALRRGGRCLVRRGVPAPGVGGCSLGGESAPRGSAIPACTKADPPVNRMTDRQV